MKPTKQGKVVVAKAPAVILSMAQHGLPRTPRTVALARLLSQIAQNMAAKAA